MREYIKTALEMQMDEYPQVFEYIQYDLELDEWYIIKDLPDVQEFAMKNLKTWLNPSHAKCRLIDLLNSDLEEKIKTIKNEISFQ